MVIIAKSTGAKELERKFFCEIFEGKFFCEICDTRVDLCRCKEFEDLGCWDCGPNCKIDQRRKVMRGLKLMVRDVPETRFGKCLKTVQIYIPPHTR